MVRLELEELNEDRVIYRYYPENMRDHPGIVGLDRHTEKPLFIQDAEGDPVKMYASKEFLRIKDYAKADDFREVGSYLFY